MKQSAVVIAPGRGTYTSSELGYLARHHPAFPHLSGFDGYRESQGQTPVSDLDRASRYSNATHTRGDNASALIYACGLADFDAIDRDRIDILGVTGNSMGWYTALACAQALDPMAGFRVANTMGTLMQEHMIGGQMLYPFVDDTWREIPGQRSELISKIDMINATPGRTLALSIELGGMLVVAGNEEGLADFQSAVPRLQDRYPMRLPNHAGFHTSLQRPVSDAGKRRLPPDLFQQPQVPLIDGRGAIWHPYATNLAQLYDYTLGHQVTEPYDFTSALRTAARELMPDVFIILGPGTTLGGASGQALIRAGWRGWSSKSDVQSSDRSPRRLLSMGHPDMRNLCAKAD